MAREREGDAVPGPEAGRPPAPTSGPADGRRPEAEEQLDMPFPARADPLAEPDARHDLRPVHPPTTSSRTSAEIMEQSPPCSRLAANALTRL